MKNLQKYTKAELITQLKNKQVIKDNYKSLIKNYLLQIWDLILTFKNILFKLTLISLIIQFFRKYRMFRKVWFTIQTIVMAIFGISLFENSLFDIISNIISEIRFIGWNITHYLTDTNFYNYLSKLFGKNETKDLIKEVKSEIIKEAKNEIINDVRKAPQWTLSDNSRLSEWLKPQREVIEQTDIESNYKKYLYLIGFIVVSSLTWYYFDEIKTGGVSLIEWLMSFRTGPGDSARDDSNSGNTHIQSNIPIETKNSMDPYFIDPLNVEGAKPIEIIDKGKAKMLSPSASLENLNEQVKESWSEAPKSPSGSSTSSSSTATITPLNINTSEEILNKTSDSSSTLSIFNYIKDNWRKRLDDKINTKMNFIEKSCELDLSPEEELKLVDYFSEIVTEYNKDVDTYNFMKDSNKFLAESSEGMKRSIYYFRKWISEYQGIVLPESTIIEEGSIIDSPKILNKDMFYSSITAYDKSNE